MTATTTCPAGYWEPGLGPCVCQGRVHRPPAPWAQWVADYLRVAPEPASLPDDLEDATPAQLGEARSRLLEVAKGARQVRLAIDAELARRLGPHGALRYGDSLLRPSRLPAEVQDHGAFWRLLRDALNRLDEDDRIRLLEALWSVSEVKLSGLKHLAAALEVRLEALRGTLVGKKATTTYLYTTARSKWPGWARDMAEGEALLTAPTFPTEAEVLAFLEQGPQHDEGD